MTNPFQNSAADWETMADALREAEDGRRQSDQLAIKIMAENEILHAHIADARNDLNFWMRYAVQIETRLDGIQNVIRQAQETAMELARSNEGTIRRTMPETAPAAPSTPAPRQDPTAALIQPPAALELRQRVTNLSNRWP